MRRTASEIVNYLEMRVASLEKQAIFGLFKGREEVTLESEQKLLESHVKATRGVSDVSIDLSDKKKITMDVRFHGVHFHFVGKCIQDLERVYDGYYKSANPSLFLMQRARSTGRSPSLGGGRRMGGIGNIYSFQHGDTRFSLHTDSGEIYRKNNNEIYEKLKALLSKNSGSLEKRAGGGIGFFSMLILMQRELDREDDIYVTSEELETALKDYLSLHGLPIQTKFEKVDLDLYRDPDGLELTFEADGRYFYTELSWNEEGRYETRDIEPSFKKGKVRELK
jgi:hypothetical protein